MVASDYVEATDAKLELLVEAEEKQERELLSIAEAGVERICQAF